MKTRTCMICREPIPVNEFKGHFLECRTKFFDSKRNTKNGAVTKKKKGCGCGKGKKK